MDAALLIAGALLAVGTPAPLAEQNPLALPGPASLEREVVQAWTRKYVRGDDWRQVTRIEDDEARVDVDDELALALGMSGP